MKNCSRCGRRISDSRKSGFCRWCYFYEYAKKKRKKRVENGCCASCGNKVKPKVIIPYRCEECQDKIREYNQEKLSQSRSSEKQ